MIINIVEAVLVTLRKSLGPCDSRAGAPAGRAVLSQTTCRLSLASGSQGQGRKAKALRRAAGMPLEAGGQTQDH